MAEWIEPKTDWVSNDYFNAEDYNRIKNNISFLKNFTDDLFGGLNWITGKNLLSYPYYETTHTEQGVTWTDNGDGTVTANGTALGVSNFFVKYAATQITNIQKGIYKVTGCPKGGSDATYRTFPYKREDGQNVSFGNYEYGDGLVFDIDDTINFGMSLQIMRGVTVNNLVFKPMIRLATDTNDTWEPYYTIIPDATSDLITIDRNKKQSSLIYAREINNIEKNIETINLKTYQFDIGDTKEYLPNTRTIDYVELNRIESAILMLYETMVAHKNALSRLAFKLGGQKGIKV